MTATMTTLDAALDYAARGWRVVPLYSPVDTGGCNCYKHTKCPYPGKHPRPGKWTKIATTNPDIIRGWWDEYPVSNVGVVTGPESGIFCLDVDVKNNGLDTLKALQESHGPLPPTVESVTGGGGSHLIFKYPNGCEIGTGAHRVGMGLDIRSGGGQFVAPPSVHASGAMYQWKASHGPDEMSVADAPPWLLALVIEQAEQMEAVPCSLRSITDQPDCSITTRERPCSITLDEAINRSLPRVAGQRNERLFLFARLLKSMPEYRDRSTKEMKPIIRRWFDEAKQFIDTKDFESTWMDFIYIWDRDRVKHPVGEGPVDDALRRADLAPVPAICAEYDDPDVHRMVKLCRELQRVRGSLPFFLSCDHAARLLGFDHPMKAWRMLNMLRVEGVLELVENGTKTKAARYRYLQPLDDQIALAA